jgi:hypothetical protein
MAGRAGIADSSATHSLAKGVDILRPHAALASALLTFSLLTVAVVGAPIASAATVAATTTCSNSVDNTPGLGAICEIDILNTITATGGSSIVTARECHGAAGDPEAACTGGTPVALTEPVTIVNQCNDAMNGGGGTLRCSVHVTNIYVDDPADVVGVTVNQCVGSGGGITTGCDPFPATTSGADITQCNASANGGTLVELTCTATGEQASGFVTINQCNGSTNGGGALVICSTNIETRFEAPSSAAPSSEAPSSPGSSGVTSKPVHLTQPPTDAPRANASAGSSSPWVILIIVGSAALALGIATRRRSVRL